jgi:Poxvirus A32 protein
MATNPSHENAASKLQHPTRLLIVGSAQSGKTSCLVNIIKTYYAPQVNRAIICCPTFPRQRTYDPIRSLFKKEDVYTKVNNKTLQLIMDKLEHNLNRAEQTGTASEKVLIIIDDMAGNSVIHGKRQGPFASLACQTTHWNMSLFVISQQPTCCDPNFRDNAENILCFPDKGETSYIWLKAAYTSLDMDKHDMRKIILTAWRGGRVDNEERGKHFLYIHAEPRGGTRFFIDFTKEIKINV